MFLDFVVKCLKITSAISENKEITVLLTVVMVLIDVLTLGGMILAFFSTTEITYLTLILGLFFCTFFGCTLHTVVKFYKRKFLRILSKVYSEHSNSLDFIDEQITQKAEVEMEQRLGSRIIVLVLSLSLYIFTPYLSFATKPGITFEDPDLQILPFSHPYWKTHTVYQFISKGFLEMLMCSTIIISYWSFIVFMVYTIINVETHIQEINRQFKNAINENIQKYMIYTEFRIAGTYKCGGFIIKNSNNEWKRNFEKSVNEEFVKLIKYQQFLHSYISDVTSFLNKPFTFVFAWYLSSTILFSYAFLQVTDNSLFIMKLVILLGHGTWALFIFCDVAEVIHHMNEQIMDSFYNTEWYHLSPKFRKNLLFVLSLGQRKYKIKSFGMYVVNLNLYLYALRTVYSALNIVVAMQKK